MSGLTLQAAPPVLIALLAFALSVPAPCAFAAEPGSTEPRSTAKAAAAASIKPPGTRTLSFTADELQRSLREHFPQRRCLLGLACLKLTEPYVQLLERDPHIYVSAIAEPEVSGSKLYSGVLQARGKPRYRPSEGAFYVDQPQFTRIDFPGLSAGEAGVAAEIGRILLTEVLAQQPIWQLDERDPQQSLARLALQSVEVRDAKLVVVFRDERDQIPQYEELDPADIDPDGPTHPPAGTSHRPSSR